MQERMSIEHTVISMHFLRAFVQLILLQTVDFIK